MFISELQLKNFKRFTDLTINIGEDQPKLVLLIGANGSGKTAIFDAFELIGETTGEGSYTGNKLLDYYRKKRETPTSVAFKTDKQHDYTCEFALNTNQRFVKSNFSFTSTSFYGRSAIRYLPRLSRRTIGQVVNVATDTDKPQYYIETDNRFENDIDILIKDIIDRIFKGINQSSSDQLDEIKRFLNRINAALPRIFGEDDTVSLRFIQFIPPSDGQPSRMIFKKGQSEINYDFLSSGEKEVINILFNLFVRTPYFQDTIYFFDELDTHLHTTLQYNLLKEIVENWIPDNCQLWTASHSLGFIEYAQKSQDAIIIDFDNYDFDKSVDIEPKKTPEVFDIAVPRESLNGLFKGKKLVFCEGQDAFLLNSMGLEDVIFLSEVDKNAICLRIEMEQSQNAQYYGLIDRDFISEQERDKLMARFPNLKVLEYYCFENYLWHPENIKTIAPQLDVKAYQQVIREAKNKKFDDIFSRLRESRKSYVFFKTEKNWGIQDKELQNTSNLLKSDDFETFYKVFKMKDNGDLCPIKNLRREDLVKTQWFKSKFISIFENS